MRKLLLLSLLLMTLPVTGQQEREQRPNERLNPPDYSDHEMEREELWESPKEKARKENDSIPTLEPPAIAPEGWLHDYDYRLGLFEYLRRKQRDASSANKNTYVYLFADWNAACVTFRKSASHKDYKELFLNNEIVMVEYAYMKRLYGAQFNKLPVFLKVHSDGSLGPEKINPISNPNDHPRRAYYKLKKFLEANEDSS
jgi:hypothetical protein